MSAEIRAAMTRPLSIEFEEHEARLLSAIAFAAIPRLTNEQAEVLMGMASKFAAAGAGRISEVVAEFGWDACDEVARDIFAERPGLEDVLL